MRSRATIESFVYAFKFAAWTYFNKACWCILKALIHKSWRLRRGSVIFKMAKIILTYQRVIDSLIVFLKITGPSVPICFAASVVVSSNAITSPVNWIRIYLSCSYFTSKSHFAIIGFTICGSSIVALKTCCSSHLKFWNFLSLRSSNSVLILFYS